MNDPGFSFPDAVTLEAMLRTIDWEGEADSPRLEAREPLLFGSYPKEVVTCRLADGRQLRLVYKYDVPVERHAAHGHRRGVGMERKIYDQVLEPMGIPVPRRFQPGADLSGGPPCLIVEYLEGYQFVDACADRFPCEEAARVAARFHAASESDHRAASALLTRYDADFYRGWARRAARFLEPWSGGSVDLGWIRVIEERCEEWIGPLLNSAPVLIHGEYYPWNILFWKGEVVLIDWESAALAAGEIDLATLTDGWGRQEAESWEAIYRTTRWPDGPPDGHARALAAARIYLQLRWLGDRPEWVEPQLVDGRVPQLRALAEEFGLL